MQYRCAVLRKNSIYGVVRKLFFRTDRGGNHKVRSKRLLVARFIRQRGFRKKIRSRTIREPSIYSTSAFIRAHPSSHGRLLLAVFLSWPELRYHQTLTGDSFGGQPFPGDTDRMTDDPGNELHEKHSHERNLLIRTKSGIRYDNNQNTSRMPPAYRQADRPDG